MSGLKQDKPPYSITEYEKKMQTMLAALIKVIPNGKCNICDGIVTDNRILCDVCVDKLRLIL
jgi:recombinational DNA repair protein RecR